MTSGVVGWPSQPGRLVWRRVIGQPELRFAVAALVLRVAAVDDAPAEEDVDGAVFGGRYDIA